MIDKLEALECGWADDVTHFLTGDVVAVKRETYASTTNDVYPRKFWRFKFNMLCVIIGHNVERGYLTLMNPEHGVGYVHVSYLKHAMLACERCERHEPT